MTKQKKQLIAQKTINELQLLAQELRSELSKLRMDHAKNQLKKTSLLRTKRDELARVLTAQKVKNGAKKFAKEASSVETGEVEKVKKAKIVKKVMGKHVQGRQMKSKKEGQK